MDDLKKIVRKKGETKIIIYSILIFVMLIPVFVFHKQVIGSFKGTCTVTDIPGLDKCREEGRFIKIKTKNIYDAGYNYVVEGKTVGKFLDVDINGNVILTLADTVTADELLSGKEERTISGHMQKFNSELLKETLSKVQKDYVESYANDAGTISKADAERMFYPYLLNQYDGHGFPYIIPVLIVGSIVIVLIFKVLDGIKMVQNPEKFIIYGKKQEKDKEQEEKANFELQNGPFIFESKKVKITNNFIFNMQGDAIIYHKNNDAVWMYEQSLRRYGLFETGKNLIIRFKDHTGLRLALKPSEQKNVMEIIRVKNKKVLIGYSDELEQKYKTNPEKMN